MSPFGDMAEEYITICADCAKGITKEQMQFVKGRSFHAQCYAKSGNQYVAIDPDLLNMQSRAKIDLIYLKNLRARTSQNPIVETKSQAKSIKKTKTARKTKAKAKKKTTKARKTTRKTKAKAKKKTTKARKTTRKTKRK